jgi:hypothetical protein
MPNLLSEFRSLIPDPPLLVGVVDSITGGVATLTLPDGSTATARGSATVGQRVFFRDGAIEGQAPSLTTVVIEI